MVKTNLIPKKMSDRGFAFESNRIVVEDLAFEISSLLADANFRQWDKTIGNPVICDALDRVVDKCARDSAGIGARSLRRLAATHLYKTGNSAVGLPGVTPSILKMLKSNEICFRSTYNGLSPDKDLDQTDDLKLWYLSSEDAEKVEDKLMPERLRQRIKSRALAGRFTLIQVVDALNESFEDGMLDRLESAALSGELPVYRACNKFCEKSDSQFTEEEMLRSSGRGFYEEATWSDLNNWLATHEPSIEFRFPEPENGGKTKQPTLNGVPKFEILAVDWPLSKQKAPPLKKILNALPTWVKTACSKVGRPGAGRNGSHLWNPGKLAYCLSVESTGKRWIVDKKKLSTFIKTYFPDYLETYVELLCADRRSLDLTDDFEDSE